MKIYNTTLKEHSGFGTKGRTRRGRKSYILVWVRGLSRGQDARFRGRFNTQTHPRNLIVTQYMSKMPDTRLAPASSAHSALDLSHGGPALHRSSHGTCRPTQTLRPD